MSRNRAVPELSRENQAYARSLLIHEDAAVMVFNKPAGLAVQGGSGVDLSLETLLAAFAKSNGKRPRLVHRLDRETSGVIVAARTKPAAAFLSEAFAQRRTKKIYHAIVSRAPSPPEGEIALALKKSTRRGLDIMEVAIDGQAALTRYRTCAAASGAALLELNPETGRMHQLRAHLAAIGCPIAGDGKYGGLYVIGATKVPGLMLHAASLSLPLPDGAERTFSAPAPEAFAAVRRSLGLETAPG